MNKNMVRASLFCSLLCVGLWTVSCKDNCKGKSSEENDTEEFESDDAKDEWTNDSIAKTQEATPDLSFFNLHGPVKYVIEDETSIMQFDEEGKLTSMNGYDPFVGTPYDNPDYIRIAYDRDKKGRIAEWHGWEACCNYTWKDGLVVHASGQYEALSEETDYKYNKQKEVIEISGYYSEFGDESQTKEMTKFSYPEHDKYGNWTKKIIRSKEDDGDFTEDESERMIVYYPILRPGAKPTKTSHNPEAALVKMNGTIGGNSDCSFEVGPKGGEYVLPGGPRQLKIAMFNPEDNTLFVYAYVKSSVVPIGIFKGKIESGTYKGVFTNLRNDGKVEFNLNIL